MIMRVQETVIETNSKKYKEFSHFWGVADDEMEFCPNFSLTLTIDIAKTFPMLINIENSHNLKMS